MSIPLWKVKLIIPPLRPGSVARPRLIKHLNATTGCKLTLLSAPAGYGKTTLLSQWIESVKTEQRDPPQIAWLSLDEEDNDPARFTAHFASALQTVPALDRQGIARAILSRVGSSDFARAGIGSINDLVINLLDQVEELGQDLVLVLDDYHYVTTEGIHNALSTLLKHLPPRLHVVIATRVDPPLPIASLRAKGQLVELRLVDLRFTSDEVGEYLNQTLGPGLSTDDLASLTKRTEGWIAGLRLAAVSLQGQEDMSAFIDSFAGSDRYVMDYLMQEVFERQPKPLQTFLLETSILHNLSGALCDAVTGRGDSQATLEYLERGNLFIVPLDSERHWYRYHQLFSDLLRNRLQEMPFDVQSRAHRRASQWFQANDMTDEAIVHALASADYPHAGELLERHARAKLASGEVATVVGWMQKFPEQLLRERPSLNLIYGWALLLSGLPLPQVKSRMRQMYQEGQFDQVALVGLEAYLAILQDGPNQTEVLRQSLQTLPPDDLFMRSLAASSLGLYTMDHDPAQASRMLAEATRLTQEAGEVFASVLLLYMQSVAYLLSGRLSAAQTILKRALELATDPKGRLPVAGLPLVGLGLVAWERNELDAAIQYLTEGILLCDQYRGTMAFFEGHVTLAKVRLALGDIQDVCAALGEAQRFAKELGSPLLTQQIDAVWAELALRQGNLEAARNWVDEQVTIHPDDLLRQAGDNGEATRAIQQSLRIWRVWARVLIANGEHARAVALLDEILADAQRRGMNQKLIEVEMLRSLAFQAGGEIERAISCLRNALTLAEPEGYISMFVSEGQPMARLLYTAAGRGIFPSYTGHLLAAFPAFQETPQQDEHVAPLIEPLSTREREVLQLLEKGLSNQEVAEHLVISLSTVKSHTASIFAKLDVHSRARAVTRARDLSIFLT